LRPNGGKIALFRLRALVERPGSQRQKEIVMAKVLNLQAPKSMSLRDMKAEEIAKYVSEHADVGLRGIPEGVRPVGVNAVSLSQSIPGGSGGFGGWAEWTRACRDRSNLIEDYTDPMVVDFEHPDSLIATKFQGERLESQLRVQALDRAIGTKKK
jgi:hypothetical protein